MLKIIIYGIILVVFLYALFRLLDYAIDENF